MLLLSRFWYALLSLILAFAIYIVFLAVGQYNRRNQVAMSEALAADSQVVKWALQIDARRRLDALLVGAVDKGLQDSLFASSSAKGDKVPAKSRDEARKALDAIAGKLPVEYKPDALFAVDRDGRVVAQSGFDPQTSEYFELGGFPAVYDALHGFLRDDTWVLGARVYRVVARPVEYDVSQPPAGAIVGIRAVDAKFAQETSRLTRANIAFFANGVRVSSAATEGFDDKLLEQLTGELPKVEADKAYQDSGRSSLRLLNDDSLGATYVRFDGDAWTQRAGYVVARTRVSIAGPIGFLQGADDKDKASVPWLLLVLVIVAGVGGGIAFPWVEHTVPLKKMAHQAYRLRKGEVDLLPLPEFRGALRPIAQEINSGIERVAEKGGGAPRKQADLESILGPVPAQPAMSAFSFPGIPEGPPPPSVPTSPGPGSGPGSARFGPPSGSGSRPGFPSPAGAPGGPGSRPFPQASPGPAGPGFPPRESPSRPGLGGPNGPPMKPPPMKPPVPPPGVRDTGRTAPGGPPPAVRDTGRMAPVRSPQGSSPAIHEASSSNGGSGMFGGGSSIPPPFVVDEASGLNLPPAPGRAGAGRDLGVPPETDEATEWLVVYEDFVRTKKQCGESTDGLTFEKFQHTLKKNRDALIQRHGCKRVRFSVYVKDGRASLKATPVKE